MNIAIVDDEQIELTLAETYIKKYICQNWSEIEAEIKIQTFNSAKDFLHIFKPNMFQLVILDIRMKEINGIQAAQIIRARGDNEVNIIFLTFSEDFIMNGYRVFAVGYFLKPISVHKEDFAKTFEHIFPKIAKKSPELTLNVNGADFFVPYRNILYMDIDYSYLQVEKILSKFPATKFFSPVQKVIENFFAKSDLMVHATTMSLLP